MLLRVFLGGARDPGVLDRSDADLLETAHREMAPVLGLAAPRTSSAASIRWPAATPQMLVGHLERMDALDRRLAAIPASS